MYSLVISFESINKKVLVISVHVMRMLSLKFIKDGFSKQIRWGRHRVKTKVSVRSFNTQGDLQKTRASRLKHQSDQATKTKQIIKQITRQNQTQ